ncbi:MAG: zinc transporter ZupT [Defluviitaleaceae bacterium]|nr:zinc transporter ZupT [Defluviitaleaceae bacterium]
MNEVLYAFLLTLIAGLFTAIGGLITLFQKKDNANFLALALSFSAGVMVYVSFVEIFTKALYDLEELYGPETGLAVTTIAFFGGILFIAIIMKLVPEGEDNIAEFKDPEARKNLTEKERKSLRRMGIMTALAIAIHNFPEGLVTFVGALQDPALGATIAAAIAIHNIPEGIAVAVPIKYATGSKVKAFWAAALSGLTEPLGALVGYFLILQWLGDNMLGIVFASVGGIMVYISIAELLPTAHKYGDNFKVTVGFFAGMFIMAVSLILLNF